MKIEIQSPFGPNDTQNPLGQLQLNPLNVPDEHPLKHLWLPSFLNDSTRRKNTYFIDRTYLENILKRIGNSNLLNNVFSKILENVQGQCRIAFDINLRGLFDSILPKSHSCYQWSEAEVQFTLTTIKKIGVVLNVI